MIKKDIHIKFYSSLDYHFQDDYAQMKAILDTSKEIEYFKEELSIEAIVLSIRKLKEQVKILETKRTYGVPQPESI